MLFASPLVQGDITILEYYEPLNVIHQGFISIDFIIHDYNGEGVLRVNLTPFHQSKKILVSKLLPVVPGKNTD